MSGDPMLLSLAEIERRCRNETENYRRGRESDPRFCLEIFRRALDMATRHSQAFDAAESLDLEAARTALYRIYTPFIEACISADALRAGISKEDLVQEVWMAFWRTAAKKQLTFQHLPQALMYLRRVARTTVLYILRSARTSADHAALPDLAGAEDIVDPNADPFRALERRLFLERVRDMLGLTSLEYRVFWLRYQQGLPPRDLAPLLRRAGLAINKQPATEQSVYRLLNRVMAQLADDSVIRDLLSSEA